MSEQRVASAKAGDKSAARTDGAGILAITVAAAAAVSALAYAPAAGAGFQSDDFRWLWHARVDGWHDVARIFSETLGFYRPFTQLSWTFDLQRAGPDPLAFFVTNLVLHILALALFALVARRLLDDAAGAAAAVLLAALSHHYNNMAVLWISGRGALLGAAAALAALWWWDRWCRQEGGAGAWIAACAAMAVGLGAYEAVAAVPLLMAAMIPLRGGGARPLLGAAGPLGLWVPYLWIRLAVGARQPWSEGQGYRYELGAVLPNLLEYVGRALMVSAILVAVVLLVAVAARRFADVARVAAARARGIAALGLLWFVIGLLPALPVVNRSNLYVYFAALGLHLIVGAALAGAGRELARASPAAARIAAALLAVLVLVAWPLFAWDRNGRIAEQARLSMAAVAAIRNTVPDPAPNECIVLVDDPGVQPNLHQALSHDLHWLGAFVYTEEPSDRVRYADDTAAAACSKAHRLRFGPSGFY